MANLNRSYSLILAVLLLVGCTQPTIAPPLPTPNQLIVAHPASLEKLARWLSFCAQSQPDLVIFVEEISGADLRLDQNDLVFWLGEPLDESGFSAPLGWDELVIILNPANPIQALSQAQVTSLYTGQVSNWESYGGEPMAINLWTLPTGNEIFRVFERIFLRGEPVTSMSRIAPSPAAMLQAVAKDKQAIGFLTKSWLGGEVNSVKITEIEPDSLIIPLLALAKSTPSGSAANFLVCLQSTEGQKAIPENYQPWK